MDVATTTTTTTTAAAAIAFSPSSRGARRRGDHAAASATLGTECRQWRGSTFHSPSPDTTTAVRIDSAICNTAATATAATTADGACSSRRLQDKYYAKHVWRQISQLFSIFRHSAWRSACQDYRHLAQTSFSSTIAPTTDSIITGAHIYPEAASWHIHTSRRHPVTCCKSGHCCRPSHCNTDGKSRLCAPLASSPLSRGLQCSYGNL